jgi:2-polyprenyl-3-methyl-5-hydroxy-6-metoxy-1,4-benzoquinol methylase
MKQWDDHSGDWQGLVSSAQARRYQAIASAIERHCRGGSVLDVGCGEAVLKDYLPQGLQYTGIEPSSIAVESARVRSGSLQIIHGRCEDVDLSGRQWDCIVFNEVLYYLQDPAGLMERFASSVRRGGVVITSIYQKAQAPSPKARLLHWLDRRRPLSNVHCTKLVHEFMGRRAWKIEQDDLITAPDHKEPWRLTVARPVA